MSEQRPQLNSAALKRLPSLKPPRDVTLSRTGGAPSSAVLSMPGAVRPKFAPNLAVAGKRATPSAVTPDERSKSEPQPGSGGQRGRGGRGGGRPGGDDRFNKRAKKDQPEIIQSQGIFSDGFAEGAGTGKSSRPDGFESGGGSKSGFSFGGGSGSGKSGGGGLRRSATNDSSKSIAIGSDEAALSELLKDNFISDIQAGDMEPLLFNTGTKFIKKEKSNLKNEDKLALPSFATEDLKPENEKDDTLFKNENSADGSFIFVQLPSVLSDMLSNRVNNTIEPKKEIKTEFEAQSPTSSTAAATRVSELDESKAESGENQQQKHILEDFPDGLFGKLQILKSGRMRLKLNSSSENEQIYFDVDLAKASFAQDLAYIHCDGPTENDNVLNVLSDKIQHRMLITPNIETISRTLTR